MTPQQRLAQLEAAYPMDDEDNSVRWSKRLPFLLIEESRSDGSYFRTVHASLEDAGTYHVMQESPEDWNVKILIDLRDGSAWEPEIVSQVIWTKHDDCTLWKMPGERCDECGREAR